jgi:hypothetical protein
MVRTRAPGMSSGMFSLNWTMLFTTYHDQSLLSWWMEKKLDDVLMADDEGESPQKAKEPNSDDIF